MISIEIVDADGITAEVDVETAYGAITLLGNIAILDRTLTIDRAHIQGLTPGKLGRAGLNVLAQRLLEVANVETIVVQGSRRTTGARPGRVPRAFRYPHRGSS